MNFDLTTFSVSDDPVEAAAVGVVVGAVVMEELETGLGCGLFVELAIGKLEGQVLRRVDGSERPLRP